MYFVGLRVAKHSCGRRNEYALERIQIDEGVPSVDDFPTDSPRQDELTKRDAVRAGRSAQIRCEKRAEAAAIRRGRSMAAPPGIAASFDDDVDLGEASYSSK